MDIFSASALKSSNKRFLMKQQEIQHKLQQLFFSKAIKYSNPKVESLSAALQVSHAILARDGKHITAFIKPRLSAPQDLDVQGAVQALNKEVGTVRHHLGQLLKARRIPTLKFVVDKDSDRIDRLESLLDSLNTPKNQEQQ